MGDDGDGTGLAFLVNVDEAKKTGEYKVKTLWYKSEVIVTTHSWGGNVSCKTTSGQNRSEDAKC